MEGSSSETEVKHEKQKENVVQNRKPISEKELKKQEWSRQMRLKFTNPDMINSDGALNEE